MKIRVDLFTINGKWKHGGIVDIGNIETWDYNAVYRAILLNQNFVINGAVERYIVVTKEPEEYTVNKFCTYLFLPTHRPSAIEALYDFTTYIAKKLFDLNV